MLMSVIVSLVSCEVQTPPGSRGALGGGGGGSRGGHLDKG